MASREGAGVGAVRPRMAPNEGGMLEEASWAKALSRGECASENGVGRPGVRGRGKLGQAEQAKGSWGWVLLHGVGARMVFRVPCRSIDQRFAVRGPYACWGLVGDAGACWVLWVVRRLFSSSRDSPISCKCVGGWAWERLGESIFVPCGVGVG